MSSNKIKLKMMIGELEDDNLIEIEDELFEVSDDNEVDFLEVMLEEGVMAKKKKVKVHGMELSISTKSLQESVNKSIDDIPLMQLIQDLYKSRLKIWRQFPKLLTLK